MDDRSARQTRVTRHNTADTHRGELSERQSRVFWDAASVHISTLCALSCVPPFRMLRNPEPGWWAVTRAEFASYICKSAAYLRFSPHGVNVRWGEADTATASSSQQPAAPWIADISWWCDDSFRTLPSAYCLPPPVAWDGHRKIITILTVTQNILLYPHFLFLSKSGGHNFDDLPFCPFVFLGLCLDSVSMCVRNAVHNLRHW